MMPDLLRVVLAIFAAVATAGAIEYGSRRRDLAPPGFAQPGRRAAMLATLVLVLYAGAFAPLFFWDQVPEFDPSAVQLPELFVVQALLLFALVAWFALGYPPAASPLPDGAESETDAAPAAPWWRQLAHQCGLTTEHLGRELALGLAVGAGAWLAVVAVLVVIAAVVAGLGLTDQLPNQPVAQVVFLAGQSVGLRIGLSVAAGVAEEIFFRGFLQPRIGVVASSLLFALAHLGYGQPFMVVGILLLSLVFAAVVRWRRNVWAAVVGHAVFDLVQLLVLVPLVVENMAAGSPS